MRPFYIHKLYWKDISVSFQERKNAFGHCKFLMVYKEFHLFIVVYHLVLLIGSNCNMHSMRHDGNEDIDDISKEETDNSG